jgi:hypothetical protein
VLPLFEGVFSRAAVFANPSVRRGSLFIPSSLRDLVLPLLKLLSALPKGSATHADLYRNHDQG